MKRTPATQAALAALPLVLVLVPALVLTPAGLAHADAAGMQPQQPGPGQAAPPGPPAPKQPKRASDEADEAQPLTDDTAYTLEGGSLRIGLWKVQYGVLDFATIGTYTLPWSVLAATVHGKVRVVEVGPVAVAVQAGFAYFDSTRLQWLDDSVGDATVTVFPIEAYASYRVARALRLSAGAAYTEVAVDGSLSVQALEGAGRGASDNFQLSATAELRMARALALIVHGRWLMLQRVVANADALLYPDPFTTVAVHGDASASDQFSVRDAFSVVPSLLLTLGVFNLRLGVGYGNYNVPLLNFVLPQRTLIPEADLYLVF